MFEKATGSLPMSNAFLAGWKILNTILINELITKHPPFLSMDYLVNLCKKKIYKYADFFQKMLV